MLNRLQVDGVIADQMEAAGGLVAEALQLPFVSVACALPVNREAAIPLAVMPFRFAQDEALQRYQASSDIYDRIMRRHGAVIARHARAFGLPERHGLHQCLSPLAQISQLVPAFDFPRQQLPACYHSVVRCGLQPPRRSPLASAAPAGGASLGTPQGHRFACFCIWLRPAQSAAVAGGGTGGLTASRTSAQTGRCCVGDRFCGSAGGAAACATVYHSCRSEQCAGSGGTPMLALPIAFDQPGVAARIEWHGVGRRASRFSRVAQLEHHLQQLLSDDRYRLRMSAIQAQLQRAGGCTRAADIVEQALCQQQIVLAEAT